MLAAEYLTDTVPLYSLDAEMAALGSMFLSERGAEEVARVVTDEDFYHPGHRDIFRAMAHLLASGVPIDEVTLPAELTARGVYERIGGWEYLAEVADKVSSAANATYYAEIVLEKSTLRKLDEVCRRGVTDAGRHDSGTAAEKIAKIEAAIFEIGRRRSGKEFSVIRQLARDFFVEVDAVIEGAEPRRGLPTGFGELDRMISGLFKGDLYIIGARPSMGKTAFACRLILEAARAGKGAAALFSLEMSEAAITERIVSMESGVNGNVFRSGVYPERIYQKLADGCERLYSLPVYIDDTSEMTAMEMRSKCRRLASQAGGLSVVAVDFLQLMKGARKSENRTQEIGEIVRSLKGLAKEFDVPVVALCQLNRGVEAREDKRPTLHDLRDSGEIEQMADVVMLLYRDAYYKAKQEGHPLDVMFEDVEEAEVIIAKQRNGPTGKVVLGFQPAFARYVSLDRRHS